MSIVKPNCFEKTNRSVGHFFFFSSTNVETKNVCPIAYNGSGISDVADFQHQSRYEAPQLNKVKMFNRSTSAAILLIPC